MMSESPDAVLIKQEREIRAALLQMRDDHQAVVRLGSAAWKALASFRLSGQARPGSMDVATLEAFNFLQAISEARPTPAPEHDADDKPNSISLSGLKAQMERMLDQIDQPEFDLNRFCERLVTYHQRLEAMMIRQSIAPRQLTPQSAAIRGWLAYLARRDTVARYRAARQWLLESFDKHRPVGSRWPRRVRMRFKPSRSLWRVRAGADCTHISLNSTLILLDAGHFDALARSIFGLDAGARSLLSQATLDPKLIQMQAELDQAAGNGQAARGRVYDLEQSFHRVNQTYFDGRMERPGMSWGQRFGGRKFGHYEFARDQLVISGRLDSPDVPQTVLDFVMFHELLHKKHGLRFVGRRSYAHTAEFKADEQRFQGRQEAEQYLAHLSGQYFQTAGRGKSKVRIVKRRSRR